MCTVPGPRLNMALADPELTGPAYTQRLRVGLAGFSANISATFLAEARGEEAAAGRDGMSDAEYARRYDLNSMFAELRAMVLQYKPVEPLEFMRDMISHVLGANGASVRGAAPPAAVSGAAIASAGAPAAAVASAAASATPNGTAAAPAAVERKEASKAAAVAAAAAAAGDGHAAGGAASAGARKQRLLREPTVRFEFKQFFGLDIGGSLAKVTFYEPVAAGASAKGVENESKFITGSTTYGKTGQRDTSLSVDFQGGRFHFIHFATSRMDGAIALIKEQGLLAAAKVPTMLCTGGGAYKFGPKFQQELGIRIEKRDEMHCLLTGLNFLLQHVPDECFYLATPKQPLSSPRVPVSMQGDVFPYLLVNIGTGVSIIRVDSPRHFERVSGTCIGGGTYWGLCRVLTSCNTFSEAMSLSTTGDATKVDMTVGDIYGGDYEQFGLKASTIAAAFGKLVSKERPREGITDGDIAASLLHLISANIAQVAYLLSQNQHVKHILFAGSYLRENLLSAGFLSYSIDYWSQGQVKALFLKHEGYFGSLGALLLEGEEHSEPN